MLFVVTLGTVIWFQGVAQPLFFEGFDEVQIDFGTGPISGVSDQGIPWSATAAGTVENGFGSENNRFFGTDTDYEVTWTTGSIDVSQYDQVVLAVDFSDEGSDLESGCNIPNIPNNNQLNIADVDYFDVFFSYDDQSYTKISTPFGCTAGCPNTMNPGDRTIYSDCIYPTQVDDLDFQDYNLTSYIDVSGQAELFIRIVLYNSADLETTSFTNVTINGSILPVGLMSFSARPLPPAKVLLEWVTSSELNNDRFELERSVDAADFQTIGILQGGGTVSQEREYRWVDQHPMPGTNYYRLRQVDNDGSIWYSDLRQVTMGQDGSDWMLAPVPARGEVTIIYSTTSGVVEIIDLLGRTQRQATLKGVGSETVSLAGLPAGQYLVRYAGSVRSLLVR